MSRCDGLARECRLATLLVSLALTAVLILPASATMKFGTLQLSGNIETQNIIRHPNFSTADFVQNRNTTRIRIDWDWVDRGKFMDRVDIPFVKRSKLYVLYRGVYDGFYDLAPGGRQIGVTRFDDMVGGPIAGNRYGSMRADCDPATQPRGACLREGLYSRLTEHARSAAKSEDPLGEQLREVYIDLKLEDLPLSFRVGRQQVIWGESDHFRLMDIWNPLDLSWHLVHEQFDEIRVPLWLIKGLYDIGEVGPVSNAFFELVYNPFDFQAGTKVSFLPQPWGAPFPDPTRCIPVPGHPGICGGQVQTLLPPGIASPIRTVATPVFDLQGTSVSKGWFQHNPEQASEVGWRFHGVLSNGLEFTTNHLYGRSRGIGAIAGSPSKLKIKSVTLDRDEVSQEAREGVFGTFEGLPVVPAFVKAEYMHPYSHIFGFTANYFEGDFTQVVFRLETAYQLGAAVQTIDLDKRPRVNVLKADGTAGEWTGQYAPLGFDKRNVWAGMVGFDRPTWLRFLNPRGTWMISGQAFWSYIDGRVGDLRDAHQTAGEGPYYTPAKRKGTPATLTDDGVGVWDSGPFAGVTERLQDGTYAGNQDRIRRFESLMTLAMTSFYRGGTVVPFISFAWDPGNENFHAAIDLQYFFTNNIVGMIQEKYFTDLHGGPPSLDPWGVGGLNHRRDETILKLTYQF
jgi:hypothetical protein